MRQKTLELFNKLTNYSPFFYLSMIIILIGIQANFFNQEFLSNNIIQILILLNMIPLTSFAVTKITKKNIIEPILACHDCGEKMKPMGNWKCFNCDATFKHGKKNK